MRWALVVLVLAGCGHPGLKCERPWYWVEKPW
jgi:hypothetical protein